MFSSQSISDFYYEEPTMRNNAENYWLNNQYAYFPTVGGTANGYYRGNFMCCQNLRTEQMPYEAPNYSPPFNYFQNNSLNQFQYIPLTPEPVSHPVFSLSKPRHDLRPLVHIKVEQSKEGIAKAIVKRKRTRTVFTDQQIEALEELYKKKQYLSREERHVVVNKLQLSDKSVKTWFQNRRLKSKVKPIEEQQAEENSKPIEEQQVEERRPFMARLKKLEHQIHEKTNEFGYVTLDDSLMNNLFKIVDDALVNDLANDTVEDVATNQGYPIYEPISPASVSDNNNVTDISSWEPAEPSETLRILFDLQSMRAFKK